MKTQLRSGNARLAAVGAIGEVLDDRHSLTDNFLSESGLPLRDQAFARHLAYGVLRWLGALEWLTVQLLNKPLQHKDRDIRRLVMIGIFQLWKDETAEHAAVHATAQCARDMGKPWAVGLVNALLRRFQREQSDFLLRLGEQRSQYAHPDWLLDRLEQDWPEKWIEIVTENNRQAAFWLRVNRQRTELQNFCNEIQQQGFTAATHPRVPDAVSVKPAMAVHKVPGFSEGQVSVQDPAAQLAVELVNPRAGDRILDACAAPGGKTCHLLERQPSIDLLALDRSPERLKMVRDNLDRLGLDCRLKSADASRPEDWWDGAPFDKILLDAPCSTTGVIRRHPEIKWLRDTAQVQKAVRMQQLLLERLWPLLNTGGILVYATCSILKSENHEQIHGFLSRHANAKIVEPGETPDQALSPGQQILPGEEGMDGFYYAVIYKSD